MRGGAVLLLLLLLPLLQSGDDDDEDEVGGVSAALANDLRRLVCRQRCLGQQEMAV